MASEARAFLPFYEPLNLNTRQFDYYALAKQGGPPSAAGAALAASVRPDYLAQLTFHRGAISAWLQTAPAGLGGAGPAAIPELVPRELEALAGGLHGLVRVLAPHTVAGPSGDGRGDGAGIAAAAAATAGMVRSEWTSGLSAKPQRMLRLESLPQELAMVYALYAATLRHAALQGLEAAVAAAPFGGAAAATNTSPPAADGGGGAAASAAVAAAAPGSPGGAVGSPGSPAATAAVSLTTAVSGLRRAAGVYAYLADELLPELRGGGGGGDKPLELQVAGARTLQRLCLAEAQAFMAAAAAAKGLSTGAQRALHAGCVTLFRQAEEAARELSVAAAPTGLPPSERLTRLLGASAGLHAGRAALLMAAERQKALEMGEAEAACEESLRLLDGALKRLDRSDPRVWADVIKAQQSQASALQSAVHKERLTVTYQALPRQPPDATSSAAVKVAAEPFAPAPITPPAPPPEQAGKGGCAVM